MSDLWFNIFFLLIISLLVYFAIKQHKIVKKGANDLMKKVHKEIENKSH